MARGKKRKMHVRRQPGGRVDHRSAAARAERAEDAVSVAREARQRVFGLTAEQAALPIETGVLGRLRIVGDVTAGEYAVLTWFAALKRRYDAVMDAPRDVTGTTILARLGKPVPDQDPRSGPLDPVARDDRDRETLATFVAAEKRLNACRNPQARAAVYLIAVQDGWDPRSDVLDALKAGAAALMGWKSVAG